MTEPVPSKQSAPAPAPAPPTYRPFTLAKAGELAAYKDLPSASHSRMTPVFVVPAREWDYDNKTFAKTPAAHLADLPRKLHAARGNRAAYIDFSLLDDESLIHGKHPLQWLILESQKLGLLLMPLATPQSSPSFLAAAKALHADNKRGLGVRLRTNDWPDVNPTEVTRMMSAVGVTAVDVDLFLDFEGKIDSLIIAGTQNEMRSASAATWRNVTVGGSSWPQSVPAGKGLFTLARNELTQYVTAYAGLKSSSARLPDFFDHLVVNPETALDIDPKLLTISATFRYTAAFHWVFVRGGLYKASGGKGIGGASVAPALQKLIRHQLYGTPIRTRADTWIDAAAAGGLPGNATTWRRWATYRHLEITLHSLANSL